MACNCQKGVSIPILDDLKFMNEGLLRAENFP